MKRFLSVLLASTLLLGAAPVVAHGETLPPPSIFLDGLPLEFPIPPVVENDRTMVPFRAIAEALDVAVTWHDETRTIKAVGLDHQVQLTINDPIAYVDGKAVKLDVAPRIEKEWTLVPLRFFSEAFRAKVNWDNASRRVTVVSPVRPMRTLGFYALASFGERSYVPRLSDVAYGWATLKPDGHVDLTEGEYHWPEPAGDISGDTLLADAKRAGTRRYLMIHKTDGNGDLTQIVLDPIKIEHVAADVANVVQTKGFDGVELDLEGLGWAEKGAELERVRQGFSRLVQAVAQRMRAQGKETIVSMHPLNGAYHGYDYVSVANEATFIQLMAHDYAKPDKFSPEPIDKVQEAIRLTLDQVDRKKVLLGITAPYESPETLLQKVGLAKRFGLAGISLWRLGEIKDERMAALETSIAPLKH